MLQGTASGDINSNAHLHLMCLELLHDCPRMIEIERHARLSLS